MSGRWGWALALVSLIGCQAPRADRSAGVRTLEDLVGLYGSAETFDGLRASDFVTPSGNPIPLLSPPFSAANVLQRPEGDGINVLPAFSEGTPAAYGIAEVWKDVPEVWVQPWWLQVTGWDPSNPGRLRLAGSQPIIAVGTESFFYTAFWEVLTVEVPPDTAGDHYRSGAEILRDTLTIHSGNPLLAPLGPLTMGMATAAGAPSPIRPFSGEVVGRERPNSVWQDGRSVPYLSFGSEGFVWGDDRRVPEVPLFMFTRADGTTPAPEIPAVIGTGPIGSGKKAMVSLAGIPQFGGLTRLHTIRIPSTAALFIPPAHDDLREAFQIPGGVKVVTLHADILARVDLNNYLLKIATDPDCFAATPTTAATAAAKRAAFPTSCGFLDSQAAIETFLSGANVTRHEVLFTTPIVFFNAKKVGA